MVRTGLQLPAVGIWVGHLVSWCLSFPICEIGLLQGLHKAETGFVCCLSPVLALGMLAKLSVGHTLGGSHMASLGSGDSGLRHALFMAGAGLDYISTCTGTGDTLGLSIFKFACICAPWLCNLGQMAQLPCALVPSSVTCAWQQPRLPDAVEEMQCAKSSGKGLPCHAHKSLHE